MYYIVLIICVLYMLSVHIIHDFVWHFTSQTLSNKKFVSVYNLCPFVTNKQSCVARQVLDANEIQFRKKAMKNIKHLFLTKKK